MPLSGFRKAFRLPDVLKGDFPHLFNTSENKDYVAPLPTLDLYSVDIMLSENKVKFLA